VRLFDFKRGLGVMVLEKLKLILNFDHVGRGNFQASELSLLCLNLHTQSLHLRMVSLNFRPKQISS